MTTVEPSCSIPELTWTDNTPTGVETEVDLPLAECSVWVWCRCAEEDSFSYCSQPSSCSLEDICTDMCAGAGGWRLRCGDACVGPPCFEGRYLGEVSMVCRCPSDAYATTWLADDDQPEVDCDPGFPTPTPFPWELDYGTFDASLQIPTIIFPEEEWESGSRGVWTWCPCDDDEDGRHPTTSECSMPCPDDGTNCLSDMTGDGHWVFRGGCIWLGPPVALGRFYGESIMVGFCCDERSFSSQSSLSESDFSRSSCDMPDYPTFWWQGLILQDNVVWNQVFDDDAAGNCEMSSDCSSWIWCQCEDAMLEECKVVWDDDACPYTPSTIDHSNGAWMPYGGRNHHGAPCTPGRFFGEVVWFCICDFSCPCEAGGYEITCDTACSEGVAGNYNFAGFSNGMPYFEKCGGGWYMCYAPNGSGAGSWHLTDQSNCTTTTNGYEDTWVPLMGMPDTAVFVGTGSATGSPLAECCTECASCASCPGSKTVTVTGLTGYCAEINGTYTASKTTNGDGTCYYSEYDYPSVPDGCNVTWVLVECYCGLWFVSVGGDSCNYGDASDFPAWMSTPQAGDCPPDGSWTMHIVTDACDPTGQTPTVVLS